MHLFCFIALALWDMHKHPYQNMSNDILALAVDFFALILKLIIR